MNIKKELEIIFQAKFMAACLIVFSKADNLR